MSRGAKQLEKEAEPMSDATARSAAEASPLVPPHIASLHPYVPGKPIEETERELGIKGVLKLASNENALGPSPKALEAVRAHLGQSHLYPDGSCFYLKRDLAERLGVRPEELIVGNGSNEVIEHLIRTFVWPEGTRPGADDEAVVADGSFIMYRLALQAHGVRIATAPMKENTFDLDAMAEVVGPRTKMVFVANPNNPTGTWVGQAAVARFLDRLPEHVIPVMDEAYFEYVADPDYPDSLKYRDRHPNLVVLRTFSKIYGLAGLRCGYGVMPERLAGYIERLRAPFNVSALAQVACRAALGDTEHLARSRKMNDEGLAYLSAELPRLGVGVTPSVANFVLADFGRDGNAVFQALLRKGVIVRPMGGYGFPTSARITVGTAEENRRLVAALGEVLSE
jgi:histidinol-phosphate aminotransferase